MRARTALLVLLTVGVVGVAAWLVFFSPALGVRSVEIVGNLTVPQDRVKEKAAVPSLHPLATVDLEGVEARVLTLPQLATAKAERVWPGTLRIRVTERRPVASLPVGGRAALVDAHGVVIEVRDLAPAWLPVLKVDRPAAGDPATMAALKVVQSLPGSLAGKVRQVSATTAEGVSLELTDGRTVFWGGAERGEEKARILARVLGRKADVYDVSSPDVVTLK
ncbi:cell division protein FtsQ/DivIB [Nonomuraea roseoviolacea]|uniref:cell division protein FtsQ/DivIB n=1 Tax=Nonomuraea roseoviolacea TaxID=103837 RepID=UPI0031D4AF1D